MTPFTSPTAAPAVRYTCSHGRQDTSVSVAGGGDSTPAPTLAKLLSPCATTTAGDKEDTSQRSVRMLLTQRVHPANPLTIQSGDSVDTESVSQDGMRPNNLQNPSNKFCHTVPCKTSTKAAAAEVAAGTLTG